MAEGMEESFLPLFCCPSRNVVLFSFSSDSYRLVKAYASAEEEEVPRKVPQREANKKIFLTANEETIILVAGYSGQGVVVVVLVVFGDVVETLL